MIKMKTGQIRLIKNLVAGLLVAWRLVAADALADSSTATQPVHSDAMDTQQKSGKTIFALMSPPAAQTADSIAILWDKPEGVSVEGYDVYLSSNFVATTKNTDYTLQNLAAAQGYEISVRARVKAGKLLQSNPVRIATKPQPQVFDITAHGAVGDGKALNTRAIQAAIDACSAGGVVRIPAGVFVSGAIFLKSDLTLRLDEGAVLLGSSDLKDYPVMKYRSEGKEKPCYASLINTPDTNGVRWRNITIAGSGTINGNGSALRKKELAEKAAERGRLICIRDTDGLYLQGVTIRQSPFWCVHPIYCNGVTVNGVSIHTRYDETGKKYSGIVNGDGLDPDSCRDVFIFNCHIASQDDCIAIKSGRDAEGRAVGIPTENVRISHCRFTSGFGVAIGSEMAGGVRNVLVEDCVFQDTFSLASVKAIRGRGNVIENITYRDCTFTNQNQELHDSQYSRGAIYVDQFYGDAKFDPHKAKPKDESTPLIRNVLFQNISLDTVAGNAIYLTGLPESPLENIRLENITATGKHGFIANNVNGLILDNVSVEARDGNAMRFDNVK
jgi:polygalacturonase